MREAVQRIYRERKSLIASLKDAGSAVAKLDAVLLCCSLVGIIFCCLLIFNKSNTLESLVPLATIILASLSFLATQLLHCLNPSSSSFPHTSLTLVISL